MFVGIGGGPGAAYLTPSGVPMSGTHEAVSLKPITRPGPTVAAHKRNPRMAALSTDVTRVTRIDVTRSVESVRRVCVMITMHVMIPRARHEWLTIEGYNLPRLVRDKGDKRVTRCVVTCNAKSLGRIGRLWQVVKRCHKPVTREAGSGGIFGGENGCGEGGEGGDDGNDGNKRGWRCR